MTQKGERAFVVKELALLHGVPQRTIQKAITDGEISFFLIRGVRHVLDSEFDQWLINHWDHPKHHISAHKDEAERSGKKSSAMSHVRWPFETGDSQLADVVRLTKRGLTVREIAENTGISKSTVNRLQKEIEEFRDYHASKWATAYCRIVHLLAGMDEGQKSYTLNALFEEHTKPPQERTEP